MPSNSITAQTKKLRKNLRKLLERALDRVEISAEEALVYARELVARISPTRARKAA
jgi:hypothetical protein